MGAIILGYVLATIGPFVLVWVILDVGLSSIFAHFGIDPAVFYSIIGGVIGLIKVLCDGHWLLRTMACFVGIGYMVGRMGFDGILLGAVVAVIYGVWHEKYKEKHDIY